MSDWLDRIREVSGEYAQAQRAADRKAREWRTLVAGAVRSGIAVSEIAEAAGISRQRVYQIRDGRR